MSKLKLFLTWAYEQPCKIIQTYEIIEELRELNFPKEIQNYFNETRIERWVISDIENDIMKFKYLL